MVLVRAGDRTRFTLKLWGILVVDLGPVESTRTEWYQKQLLQSSALIITDFIHSHWLACYMHINHSTCPLVGAAVRTYSSKTHHQLKPRERVRID